MSVISQQLKGYHKNSRSLVYSYLASLPLLFLYEILLYISQPDTNHYVRIAADVWIRQFLSILGYNTTILTIGIALVVGIIIFIVDRKKETELKISYFITLILESLVYAVALGLIISRFTTVLVNAVPSENVPLSPIQSFALSLGAGLYEELFFRVILVSGFLWLFKLLKFTNWARYFAAVVTSAVLFSLAHFTGSMGEPFTLYAFVFRFLFGLALNLIYVTRGFGVAAWTHALYDTLLIFIL